MRNYLKGFRTFLLGFTATIVGGATAGGLLSPDLGADVTSNVAEAVRAFELLAGAVSALYGVLMIALRAITDTPIFKGQ